jgi:hypothetical protein
MKIDSGSRLGIGNKKAILFLSIIFFFTVLIIVIGWVGKGYSLNSDHPSDCEVCHDFNNFPFNYTTICYSCHNGLVSGAPNVSGYFSGVDKHGSATGTGWGGTLKSPYYRGYPPIGCEVCHTGPANDSNSYLFADVVNGKKIQGANIDANGYIYVMARARHDGSAPTITIGPSVTNITTTSATITWTTNENSTTWVDYGLTTAYGNTVGNGSYVTSHSVNLTGLTNHNTYHYRIISADALGNNLVTGDYSASINIPPPVPTLTHQSSRIVDYSPFLVTLNWGAVTDPDGGPVEYQVVVDDNLNFGSINYDSNWISGTSWSVSVNAIARGSSYYWKVRTRDGAHPTAVSNWSTVDSFYVWLPLAPAPPGLISPANGFNGVTCSLTYTVNFSWGAVTAPDGGAVEYQIVADDDPNFGSINYDSGWISGTSWSVSVARDYTYSWKVRAREAAHPTAVSNWSAVNTFTVTLPSIFNPPALSSPGNGFYDETTGGTYGITFSWGSVIAPDCDSCEYQIQVSQDNFATTYAQSGWLPTPTWYYDVWTGYNYWWRVKARDAVHTTTESGWSGAWSFTIQWYVSASCPLIYVWTGSEYKFQTDSDVGTIGQSPQTSIYKSVGLYKEAYTKLELIKPDSQGNYKIKLREGQKEADYVDQLKLLVVDHPAGTGVYDATAMNTYTYGYRTEPKIYTVKKPRVPRKAWYKDGRDITALVNKVDNRPAPAKHGEIDYYIFDFGTIKNTADAKLLIDGWMVFDLTSPAGSPSQQAPSIELVDAQGNWQKVKDIGAPAGDLKTMVVDLGGFFLSQDYRIKLVTGFQKTSKLLVDQVRLDESAPVPVKTQLITASSADLHYKGRPTFFPATLQSRVLAKDDVAPDIPQAYLYGAFTRYGDVRELINQTDDKFAIMRHGDELTLTFPKPAPVPRGYQRSVMLMTDLFFKVKRMSYQPANWDQITPWPYHGMSVYPPPTNKYANDPDYQAYLQNYNTRVYTKTASLTEKFMAIAALPEVPSADGILRALDDAWVKGREYLQNTLASIKTSGGGLEGSLAFLAYDYTPLHYSLNTNYVEVKIYDNASNVFTYNISSDGAEAWQSSSTPSPAAPGTVATPGQKSALASFDSSRWTTSLVVTDNTYNYQMYRFKVTQDPGSLKQVDVSWRGYGEPTSGYNVEFYFWNFSTNSWENLSSFFAPTEVNNTASRSLQAMDRPGRGAENLCTACHQGNYHQGCMNCHNNGTDHLSSPTACFYCHSHNGIRNFPDPQTTVRPSNPLAYGCHCHDDPWYDMVERDCTHCHGGWFPYTLMSDFTAPALTGGPTVSNILGDRATISWNTNENSTSYVTHGASTSYGAKVGNDSLVASHSVNLTGLIPATTYHYKVKSADQVGNEMISGDFTFSTIGANPPTTPVLIDQTDVLVPGAVTYAATLRWNASTGYNNHPLEYYVQVDVAGNFSSPNYISGWISATSWTVTVNAPQIYYWRVLARDALFPIITSNWSTADSFTISVASPPAAPVLIPNPGGIIYAYTFTLGVDLPAQPLQWNPVSAPDGDPVEYYVQLSFDPNFGSIYTGSGWKSGTSWTLTVDAGAGYYWRAMARDAVHWTSTSGWSAVSSFYIECTIPPPSSCPFIFVWDGEKYQYQTDIQGEALSMSKTNPIYLNKYFSLYGPSYIVLDGLLPDGDNLYRLKLREVQAEVDYFEEAKLLLVDYPAGYEIVSSSVENTYHFGYVNPFKIYTLKDARPPVFATDQNGNNILDKVLAVDNNPAPADIQAPEYYTFNFGPIAHPENAKLVLDGWTLYGKSVYKVVPDLPDIDPYVELINAQGQWQKVRTFGILAGDLKTMVVDLSGLFMSSDHRIRLNLGFSKSARTIIDRVRLDDSAPVAVTVTEVPTLSADLHHGGWATVDFADLQHRHLALDDSIPDYASWYLYGAFTRYGDVLPLLSADDDKLVLMRHGDELSLTFQNLAPPAEGLERTAVLKADVYYKSNKFSNTVEPLPYNGMEVYPPDPWLGPTSADYLQYIQDYNTRIYEVPQP